MEDDSKAGSTFHDKIRESWARLEAKGDWDYPVKLPKQKNLCRVSGCGEFTYHYGLCTGHVLENCRKEVAARKLRERNARYTEYLAALRSAKADGDIERWKEILWRKGRGKSLRGLLENDVWRGKWRDDSWKTDYVGSKGEAMLLSSVTMLPPKAEPDWKAVDEAFADGEDRYSQERDAEYQAELDAEEALEKEPKWDD